jgi:hypothetical protein
MLKARISLIDVYCLLSRIFCWSTSFFCMLNHTSTSYHIMFVGKASVFIAWTSAFLRDFYGFLLNWICGYAISIVAEDLDELPIYLTKSSPLGTTTSHHIAQIRSLQLPDGSFTPFRGEGEFQALGMRMRMVQGGRV